MLHNFLISNRDEVIGRCRDKATKRFEPSEIPSLADNGVPLFLEQLVDTLRLEQSTPLQKVVEPDPPPAPTAIGCAAALNGAEMLRLGYKVEQVVQGYGDVCQAVTELAIERNVPIATGDFRTLNRCLDNAIANAVRAYGQGRQAKTKDEAEDLHKRLESFSDMQRRSLDSAIQSFTALQTGKLGLTGATAAAHIDSLLKLRAIVDWPLSEIRLTSAATMSESS